MTTTEKIVVFLIIASSFLAGCAGYAVCFNCAK